MHIRCPSCGTGYQVPDEKIPEEGMKVRCSKCSHIFEVEKGKLVQELEDLQKPEPEAKPRPQPTEPEVKTEPSPRPAVDVPTVQVSSQPTQPMYTSDMDDIPLKFKRRRTVNTALGTLIILAVAVGAFLLIWQFGIKGAVPGTPSVDVEALYNEAFGLFKQGTLDKYMEAADVLRRALGVKRDFAKAYALLSICQTYESEIKRDSTLFEQAQLNAQKALELGQNLAVSHLAYSAIYVMRDVYEEAEKELLEAEMLDPKDPLLYAIRGQLLYKQGKPDEALKDFNRAIELDSDLTMAYYQSALILKEKEEYAEALARVNQALVISPSHYGAMKLKGELESLKPEEEAEEKKPGEEKAEGKKPEGEKAEEKQPEVDEFQLNFSKARSLFNRGRSTAAQGSAERAVQLRPNSCSARTLLGWIYLDIGRVEASKEQFDAAINLSGCAEALYGMGVAYKEQGNRQAAIMYIQRFLDTNPSGPLADEAAGLLRSLRGTP